MAKADIYDQHDKAFVGVRAYVVLLDGDLVARVSIKLPKDGAGRLWAYVHWLGTPMVRGYAGGFGYDKKSAAVHAAAKKMPVTTPAVEMPHREEYNRFVETIREDDGLYWDQNLERAGFAVIQAV